MDAAQLIVIVQEYEELYNLRNPQYSNQQRRDSIWEEIGRRMNHPSAACKAKWTRIRDNHRKALNLRKTKSGQAASKMKPPKFHMELQFLTPYITDEEERITNFSSTNLEENTDLVNDEIGIFKFESNEASNPFPSTSSYLAQSDSSKQRSNNSTPTSQSVASSFSNRSASNRKKRMSRNLASQSTTATVLQKYLTSKADKQNQPPIDTLTEFFTNMARTVKCFPIEDQIRIKGQLFQMVHSVEMRLAKESLVANSSSSRTTPISVQHNPAETGFTDSPSDDHH
ncbi:hypothetical protein WA026_018783 [Henosepilachna vigintioctopunctata]|uniref:MADF domain-containing protein n=1 Tax=Henosepilachna vigintioctopunctata TaxID=420089 RepID=A0AAW1TWA1_9CUCU